jgi:membrane protein implicated in regulation of membrane protease activity
MLFAYVVALGVGGTLVLASLVFGGKDHDSGGHDADHGADHDHGHDHAGHADDAARGAMVVAGEHGLVRHDGGAADAALSLLPVTSVRFWTFFLAFFGLTGLTLTAAALGPGVVVNALLSTGVGYLSGMSVVTVGRRLQRASTDSHVSAADYAGAAATVVLPVARGRTGKIRLELKGRTVELMADTEDEQTYETKQRVMIYQMTADGRALITRPDQGEAA